MYNTDHINKGKMNLIIKTLIKLGGFDYQTVEDSPRKTWITLSQYSSMLFIPAIIGFFTSSYAGYLLSGGNLLISFLAGILYSVIIFTIDRAILSTSRSTEFSIGIFVRIMAAVMLSTLAAEPFVLLVFEDSIKEQKFTEFSEKKKPIDSEFNNRVKKLDEQLAYAEERLNRLQLAYTQEMDGTGGSGNKDKGPIYRKKLADYQSALQSYKELKSEIALKKADLKEKYNEELEQVKITQARSLAGRLDTLHKIDSSSIQWAVWILRFALIFLELMPIMIKLKKSHSWEAYWDLIDMKNEDCLRSYDFGKDMRFEEMKQKRTLEHQRIQEGINFEHEKLEYRQKQRQLEDKWELAMDTSRKKLEKIKQSIELCGENEEERVALINEIETIYSDFKSQLISA